MINGLLGFLEAVGGYIYIVCSELFSLVRFLKEHLILSISICDGSRQQYVDTLSTVHWFPGGYFYISSSCIRCHHPAIC